MAKIMKSIAAVLCAVTATLGMAACGAESAYEIAVKNGFVGDEKAWLQSLHGANGEDADDITAKDLYEEAKANGFEGSYLDFCKSLHLNVTTGNDTELIAQNIMSVVGIYSGFSHTTKGSFGRPAQTSYSYSMGSGVIIELNKEAGNALVVTNYHVLYNADSDQAGISENIYLYLYGAVNRFSPDTGDVKGNGMQARYIGGAMDYDIALLMIEGNEYLKKSAATEAIIGSSEDLHEGEEVFAIGNPEGAGISVTPGWVSVKSEYIDISALDGRDEDRDNIVDNVSYRVIRTDAAINGGNSGGALFNAFGELVGITNAKSVGEETDNMGYALPIDQVKAVYENIQANNGKVQRATLGVMVSVVDSVASPEEGGLKTTEKLVVAEAGGKGTSAYNKLNVGDVFDWIQITKADGTVGEKVYITRQYYLNDVLLTVRKGDTVTLGVLRDGTVNMATILFDKDSYFTQYA